MKKEISMLKAFEKKGIVRPSAYGHKCGGKVLEVPVYCGLKHYECEKCGAVGATCGQLPKGSRR